MHTSVVGCLSVEADVWGGLGCRWEYLGGPWRPIKAYWFKGEERHG